jgi:hypothetical protein
MVAERRRVGTGAYPYNERVCRGNDNVGATPCGCPAAQRSRWAFFIGLTVSRFRP